MEDSFDKKLVQKIRDSFNEAEFPIEEKEWIELSTLIGSEKKGFIYIISQSYFKAAAILVIIFGSLAWFLITDSENNHPTLSKNNEVQNKEEAEVDPVPQLVQPILPEPFGGSEPKTENNVAIQDEDILNQKKIKEKPISEDQIKNKLVLSSELPRRVLPDSLVFGFSNRGINDEEFFGEEFVMTNAQASGLTYREKEPIINIDAITPPPSLEIEMSGLVSYGQFDKSVNPGVSGGIGASIPVNSRLSFITGLYISNQNLKVDDNGRTISFESSAGEIQEEVYANIFALDIPLNIRYYFRRKGNSQIFFSTGFSSLTYLKESFITETSIIKEDVTQESEGVVVTRKYIEQSTNSSSSDPLSRVDLAAILNLSLGLQYDLKGSNNLTIEPYIKYPLTSLTGQDIRIGSGGIKLVINFTGKKERK